MAPNPLSRSHQMLRLLVPALCLVGCKVGPNYVEPEVPVDPAFINAPPTPLEEEPPATTAPDDVNAATLADWWVIFNDPTLTRLVEQAIAHNHDLRIATANVRQARELLIEARFQLYPIVPARAAYEHGRLSEFSSLGNERDFDVFSGGFDATWELDIFGGVRRAVESREATVGAFEATRRDVLISVVSEVARNYFELRGNQGRLAVAQSNAANQQSTYEQTVTLLEGGRGTALDTSRAESQLESTLATIPPIETIIELSIYRLGVLTGEQPAALLADLSEPAPLPEANQSLAIGVPAELIRRRPDVRAAERTLAASTAAIGVNTADLYPRITLNGSIGFETGRIGGGSFTSGVDTYSIGPRLTWAAFDLGRVKARIRASEAQTEADLANFERTVLNALEEVDSALFAYGRELRRREHLIASQEASQNATKLARQQFQDGLTDFLTLLDAERRTLETEDELAESSTRVATLLVAVYKALGGGWELNQ